MGAAAVLDHLDLETTGIAYQNVAFIHVETVSHFHTLLCPKKIGFGGSSNFLGLISYLSGLFPFHHRRIIAAGCEESKERGKSSAECIRLH